MPTPLSAQPIFEPNSCAFRRIRRLAARGAARHDYGGDWLRCSWRLQPREPSPTNCFFNSYRPQITKYTQLTHDAEGKVVPFWAGNYGELLTDGSRIYFTEISGTRVVASQVAVSGGEMIPLQTDPNRNLVLKDISADNSRLLATDFYRPSPDLPLQILPLPGGNPYPLSRIVGHDGAWSPDGSRVAYASGNDIYIAREDASDSHRVFHGEGVPYWPRWSPDAKWLSFTARDQDGQSSLWEISTEGRGLHRLDNKMFSRDGEYYYFDKYVNNDPAVFRIRLSNRRLERVVGLREIRRSQGVMGWWMGLTPDGSPMVLRDTSIEEIYVLDFKTH